MREGEHGRTVPQRLAGPEDDPIFRTVRAMRQPAMLSGRLGAAWAQPDASFGRGVQARILQTHYKPRSRARLLVEALVDARLDGAAPVKQPVKQYVYLQTYTDADEARRRFTVTLRKHRLASHVPAVVILEEWNTVAWALPNGPRLRRTQAFFRAAEFAAFLREIGATPPATSNDVPELVRYVPRKRALFRYAPPRGPALYIKVYASGGDEAAAKNLPALGMLAAESGLKFRPPAMVAHAVAEGAVVMSEVSGIQLTSLSDSSDASSTFAAIGRALASLHASPLQPASIWTPDVEMADLRAAAADLQAALPPIAGRLNALIDRLDALRGRLIFDEQRPIHGNLFGDQILVAGEHIGIVDWDDLSLGDPLYDVGRLVAHMIFLARRMNQAPGAIGARLAMLLTAYADECGRAVAGDRLGWQVAVALLIRAKISALRPLSLSWIEEVVAAMTEAEAILDDRSGWLAGR